MYVTLPVLFLKWCVYASSVPKSFIRYKIKFNRLVVSLPQEYSYLVHAYRLNDKNDLFGFA